jgi:two-component system, chemotaxis family, CheB/CheR fusion protein
MLLVALTGYGRPEDREKALEAGFDAHLVKPVDPEDLTSLIGELSARRRERPAGPSP